MRGGNAGPVGLIAIYRVCVAGLHDVRVAALPLTPPHKEESTEESNEEDGVLHPHHK